MVKPAMKKQVAGYLQEQHHLPARRATKLAGTAPSVLRGKATKNEAPLLRHLQELASECPRFGYRLLHVLLACEGLVVNRKKTYRLYKGAQLHLRPKRRKSQAAQSRVAPEVPTACNQM